MLNGRARPTGVPPTVILTNLPRIAPLSTKVSKKTLFKRRRRLERGGGGTLSLHSPWQRSDDIGPDPYFMLSC